MRLRLHAFEPRSKSNGPGVRAVIWFQGCTIGCPGCFNPQTHDPGAARETGVEELAAKIVGLGGSIDGVSISGGEPFQQPEPLLALVQALSAAGLSILVFSGYPLAVLREQTLGPEILRHVDVLIAGPYVQGRHCGTGLLGSSNQRIHLLTDRHGPSEFAGLPRSEAILHLDGSVSITGISPLWMGNDVRR